MCACVCGGGRAGSKQDCGGEGWRAFQVSEESKGGVCGEWGGERSEQADSQGVRGTKEAWGCPWGGDTTLGGSL